MALATKCPQCGALFRVVADQLKLRGGLVRCGACRAVFDAIGSLTYVEDSALAQSRTITGSGRPAAPAPAPSADDGASRALGPSTTLRIAPVAPATLAGNVPLRIELPKAPPEEPALLRRRAKAAARERAEGQDTAAEARNAEDKVPTLVAATGSKDESPAPEPVAGGIGADDGGMAAPAADTAEESVNAEATPSFMRPKRRRPRGFSVIYGGGSALLALLAIVQVAVIFRGDLMVHWPQSRLTLMELCAAFGCTVNWPTQADQLAVIGTELQAIPGTDALELTAVIRNRAAFKQALPAVEVTLTDARNRALARKVFTPADYLASAGEPSSRLQEGFGPGSDFTIRIFFEARGLAPAGFLVYPFYL